MEEAVIDLNLIKKVLNKWCHHNALIIHHDITEAMGFLLPVKIGDNTSNMYKKLNA